MLKFNGFSAVAGTSNFEANRMMYNTIPYCISKYIIILGYGNGTFTNQITYLVGSSPYGIAVMDVNLDGKPDVMTANYNDNTISVLLNTYQPICTTDSSSSNGMLIAPIIGAVVGGVAVIALVVGYIIYKKSHPEIIPVAPQIENVNNDPAAHVYEYIENNWNPKDYAVGPTILKLCDSGHDPIDTGIIDKHDYATNPHTVSDSNM